MKKQDKNFDLTAEHPYADTDAGRIYFKPIDVMQAAGHLGIDIPDNGESPYHYIATHTKAPEVVGHMLDNQAYWVKRNEMYNGTGVWTQEKFNNLGWMEKVWYYKCHRNSFNQKTWFLNMVRFIKGEQEFADLTLSDEALFFAAEMKKIESQAKLAQAA